MSGYCISMTVFVSRFLLPIFILHCTTQIELQIVYYSHYCSDTSLIHDLYSRRTVYAIKAIDSDSTKQVYTDYHAFNHTVEEDTYSRNSLSTHPYSSLKSNTDNVIPTVSQSSLTKSSVKEVYYDWNDSISQ